MLYLYYGEDDFSLWQAVWELQASLGPADVASLNTTRFSAQGLTPEELAAICSTVPFLAEGRLVLVERLLAAFEGRVGRGAGRRGGGAPHPGPPDLGSWKALADYLPHMPPTTSLVLIDGPLQGKNPLLNTLRPLARVSHFPPLRATALEAWVRRRVSEGGGEIEGPAVRSLVGAVGSNLWVLSGEVEKLLLYCQRRPINSEDVALLVGHVKEGSIFALADAFVEGRYVEARLQLRQLSEAGVGAPQIFTVLGRQVRALLQARNLLDRGETRTRIQQALAVPDFVLDKTLHQTHRLSQVELVTMHRSLLKRDLAVKTGRLSEEMALELLLAERAGLGGGPSP